MTCLANGAVGDEQPDARSGANAGRYSASTSDISSSRSLFVFELPMLTVEEGKVMEKGSALWPSSSPRHETSQT